MADYKLRNKGASGSADEESLIHRVLEKILNSSNFIEKIALKIGETILEKFQDSVNGLRSEVSQLKPQLLETNNRVEQLEQFSRLNNLRLYGIPEQENENTDQTVIDICRNKLNINLSPNHIDISHRLKTQVNGIRPILVRLVNRSTKKNIFNKKSKLKGSKIVIKEDLIHSKLLLLKDAQKCVPLKSIWTNDCKIFVKIDNKIKVINSPDDIKTLRSGLGSQ